MAAQIVSLVGSQFAISLISGAFPWSDCECRSVLQHDAPNARHAYWSGAVTEWAFGVWSAGTVGLTDGSSGRPMAAWFPRHRSSLREIWICSADRLERVGLTATGTRPVPERTAVFLTILVLLDRIIKSLLLASIELAFSVFLFLRVFVWSR